MTWEELLQKSEATSIVSSLDLPSQFRERWLLTLADQKLAWELYTELRTRIILQPLHYMHGDEEAALQSIADLFGLARQLIRSYGPEGRSTATLTVFMLNRLIRPFTAKWHKL